MIVNGEPKLTCGAFLGDFLPGPIRVEPLRFFPVIRDLIVDIGDFLRKLRSVKPWLVRLQEKPLAEGEYRQTPDQLDADQGYLSHSLAYRGEDAAPRVEALPVTITRWPPGERVYGR